MTSRRLQFNLRTLLLVVLIIGPLAGWLGRNWYEAHRRAEAARLRLRQLDVDLMYFSRPQWPQPAVPDWPNEGQPQQLE